MAENLTLVKRDIAWTNQLSVIYIDNPVGVGFSFSNNASAFVTNEQQVGEDLFKSYAGKSTINLKGDGAGQLLQLNLRVLAYSGQLDVILGAPLCL